jgi:Rad3-related DNA helicase
MPSQTVPLVPLLPGLGVLNPGLRDAQRNAAAKALALGAEPVLQDDVGLERGTLNIPSGLHEKVRLMSLERQIPFQRLWTGLVRAGFAAMSADAARMRYHIDSADPPPFTGRPGDAGRLQATYWRSVIGSLQRDRVVVAEGSTGLGKGRVLVAAALERALLSSVKPVAVAAPTLKTLAQLWDEYEELVRENPQRWASLRVRFLPGITEFVDPLKVQNYLAEAAASGDAVDEAVRSWYEGGGVSTQNSPLVRALAQVNAKDANGNPVEMKFLADDLRSIANEVEPSVLLLDPDDGKEDPRVRAAKQQAIGAHVVFCTHAMIAWQHKSQWASWPDRPKCLIIDEAHEFERAIAQANTRALALRALRRRIALSFATKLIKKSPALAAKKALMELEWACNNMIDDDADDFPQVRLANVSGDFVASFDRLKNLLSKKSYEELPRIGIVRQDIATIWRAITDQSMIGWIDFSPKRAFPSIVAGNQSLAGIMGSLWKGAEHGVALASATLTVPDINGDPKADYLVSVLSLPKQRTDMPSSVTLPAVLNLPVLHLPSKNEATALSRPASSKRTDEKEKKWLCTLAFAIGKIVSRPSVKGGTLLLLTSHAQVDHVATYLRATLGENRVIAAQAGVRFAQTQDQFVAAYRAGIKPVLIGVGSAWTGLDLSDKTVPSEADFLLTDLIIGCMPIGLNRTATMQARICHTGTNAIAKEALMMLRQGLGRLIRREGVTDRHIWFLDGRLWSDWRGMEIFTGAGRKMLQKYHHKTGMSVS